jgi:L-aminopeptidase/D-esterase-like protein
MTNPEAPIGVTIGHATDDDAQTGCTVLLFSAPALCAVDVRGGAPGTRETDLLQPGSLVQRADAILLTGGSAFGLAAADGVMSFLREQGRGFPTSAGPVPIVPAAVIFDLGVGNPVAPSTQMGYVACADARPLASAQFGSIGAGRGASVANITGQPMPGGIGRGTASFKGGSVTAIAVVNALGVVPKSAGEAAGVDPRVNLLHERKTGESRENTTLVALLIDAPAGKDALIQCAVSAHDGMARAIIPCHTPFDGDLVFSVALRPDLPPSPPSLPLTVACELATEAAIRNAIWER